MTDTSGLSIVEIIPIVRGITKETLSYFTKEALEVGSFVKVPLRKGEVYGIVVAVKDARTARNEVRKASFVLKKLSKSDKKLSLSKDFIAGAEKTATYYASSVGSILGALLPKVFLEEPEMFLLEASHKISTSNSPETLLIQMEDIDRHREYASVIRESFAKKQSILFVTPTNEDAQRLCDTLSKGIEKYSFTTAYKSPKELKKTLQKAREEIHPILFITTYSYLAFDRNDFGTLVLERENSRSYRTLSRPYIHIKVFLEFFAKASGKRLILGDSVLSLETLWKEKQGQYADLSPLRWRHMKEAKTDLIDMKKMPTVEGEQQTPTFQIFSDELKELISKAVEEKNKIFLFGVRKGLAPTTICGDCGTVLPCKNCGAPVVLHEKGSARERIYICHACGAYRPAYTVCDNCKSWKLIPLGIGIDKIKHEAEKLFPDEKIFVLDKETAPTSAKARKIAQEFASTKGGILIGTELAFLYLEKVPYAAVISLDPLFSIPDFGINERIFYLATRIREIAEKRSLFQTRNIGKEILNFATTGNILDFYRNEINERESLLYPPFSIFIKVTTSGTPQVIEEKAIELRRLFIEYNPDFIRFKGVTPATFTLSMVIRVNRIHWPDEILREKLLLLTPDFLIKVDPESIL